MYKATLITPDGYVENHTLPKEVSARLNVLQDLIGGPIEAVYLDPQNLMLLDEMGKTKPHRINTVATAIAQEAKSIQRDDYIAGVAVLVSSEAMDC